MKNRLILLACTFSFIFLSCKKDVQTDTQMIVDRLQETIKNESVVRVIPAPENIPVGGTIIYGPGYGKTYQFNSPFIKIETENYNLGRLKKYYISYVDNDKTLFLVF